MSNADNYDYKGWLTSDNFFKRAFGVFLYLLAAQLMIAMILAVLIIITGIGSAFLFGFIGGSEFFTTQQSHEVVMSNSPSSYVGGVSKTKVVGLTVTDEGNRGLITWQGGNDIGQVVYWSANANGEQIAGGVTGAPRVGQKYYTSSPITGKRVNIIVSFTDGSQQIVFDRQF